MPLYIPSPIRILGGSAVAVSGAADTNENTLATITVPAGVMGLNGIIRLQATITCTNSGNNKTHRVKFGGTQLTSSSVTTTTYYMIDLTIQNRNSASSQFARFNRFDGGSQSQGQPTATIDTSAATTLIITGQKASAGETITLESYLAELIIP